MALTITPETVNSLTITPESKGPTGIQITWADATWTWDEVDGTWAVPGLVIKLESKSNLTITPETLP